MLNATGDWLLYRIYFKVLQKCLFEYLTLRCGYSVLFECHRTADLLAPLLPFKYHFLDRHAGEWCNQGQIIAEFNYMSKIKHLFNWEYIERSKGNQMFSKYLTIVPTLTIYKGQKMNLIVFIHRWYRPLLCSTLK